MEYLLGTKKDFFEFVNSLNSDDKIGILSHTDLDGLASAVFLEKIFESKNLKAEFVEFMSYGEIDKFDKDFSKLFVLDFNLDEFPKEFERLRKKGKVFLIDHHPINEELEDRKNILKTESRDCSCLAMYSLAKEFFDVEEWSWLVCSGVIADYCFVKKENLELINKFYPDVTEENIWDSVPGELAKKINSALIYSRPDFTKVYDLILKKDFELLEKEHEIIEKEISKWEEKFKTDAEFYSEKNLYFWYFNPSYGITATIAGILSRKEPDKIFIFASDIKDKNVFVKISSRYQKGDVNLGKLLKKCIEGFENANAGGHFKASAGIFMKKDLEKFKEKLLLNL